MKKTFYFLIIGVVIFYAINSYSSETVKEEKNKMSFKNKKIIIKYDPMGRRDPFLSIIALAKQKMKKLKKKALTPLENYDVMDIKLLGIVYDGKEYYASILLPDGKAFTVKEGISLGLYGGKIIEISEDRLIVREYIMNYKGELKPKDTVLKLHKEEEEDKI